jgi:hypothetical protein
MVTGYGLDNFSTARARIFFFLHSVQDRVGVHLASYPIGPAQFISPGVKWPGYEADPSPPSGELKNGEAIPPLPHTSSWRGASLIKHRDNSTFF